MDVTHVWVGNVDFLAGSVVVQVDARERVTSTTLSADWMGKKWAHFGLTSAPCSCLDSQSNVIKRQLEESVTSN